MVISANLGSTSGLVDSSSSENDFAKSSKSFELSPDRVALFPLSVFLGVADSSIRSAFSSALSPA